MFELILNNILPDLQKLSDEDRLDFLHELSRYMCMECGAFYGRKLGDYERVCGCWNDE